MEHSLPSRVHVIGASGRSGAVLCRALLAAGAMPIPVVRRAERFRATGLDLLPRIADLTDARALAEALEDAAWVVSCAHARHAGAILAATPTAARFVFLGSTRRFTRWPDEHARGVLAGEAAWLASGRAGVMLHPTMIYGAQGEDNVRRLGSLLRRTRVVPLPGGRNLVQPIHQDDVTACVMAALRVEWARAETFVVAGPEAVTYADFVRAVARAAGLGAPWVVPVPAWVLMIAAPVTALPFLPRVRAAEIRRLVEDKAFDVVEMRRRLGVVPVGLPEGLGRFVL